MTVHRRIFITSDWHLGGVADASSIEGTPDRLGKQLCRSQRELAAFIRWVYRQADDACEAPVELIVNGDMVDFLAPDGTEPQVWMKDEDTAIERLKRIVETSPQPFEALAELLAHPRCSLTLLLGNHDVELSQPAVRRHLREKILRSEGRGLEMIYNGEACVRGRLLVEHGNRYDPWNQINFSGLRQEGSQRSRGLPVPEAERGKRWFLPPAGTLLVVHGINHLLAAYPFLNLLKPEKGAVLPLLLSLRPDMRPLIMDIVELMKIPARLREARLDGPARLRSSGALGGAMADAPVRGSLVSVLRAELGEEGMRLFQSPAQAYSGNLGGLAGGAVSFGSIRRLGESLARATGNAMVLSRAWLLSCATDRREQVRCAFHRLADDPSWNPAYEDPEYLAAATELLRTGRFSHVVFGHTHLPKSISIDRSDRQLPEGRYLNAGAWVDVIRLPIPDGDIGGWEEALDKFVQSLEEGDLTGLLQRHLGYVEVCLDVEGEVIHAEAYSWGGEGRERCDPLAAFSPA